MNVLSVRDLRKSYGTRSIFDGVAFGVEEGEKVGLIGANGSGKTTLLRILAGAEAMDGGELALRRGARVGSLAQEPELQPGCTIRATVAAGHREVDEALSEFARVSERLAEGSADPAALLARQAELTARIDTLGGWDRQHRIEAVLTRLGIPDPDRRVDGLSGGERKRVALARVLLESPDVLLLDEPTNHLDADTTEWLEEFLGAYPGAVLLVTHDRYVLDRVVDRMLEVHRTRLISFSGGYTEYLEAKVEREARLSAEARKREQLIEQELAWVRRSPSARTGKQKARIDRLESLRSEHASLGAPDAAPLELPFGRPPRLGRTVLDVHRIAKSYDGRVLFRELSTRLRAGERIGIVGPNGAGKTTLLRVLIGEESADEGRVERGANTRIAYFDQRRGDLDPDASLLRAVSDSDWVDAGGSRVHVRSYLERFLFPSETHEQPVRTLSGGERNRLLLARLLLEDANLLVLDEPTNDLDLVTLQVLESALVDFPGCVLVVTHDRFFLDKVATGLLVFEGGGEVHRHEGGYDLYRRLRAERDAARAAAEPPRKKEGRARERPSDGARRLSYRETRELEGMESAIVAAEAERDRLAQLLSDPTLYADTPDRVGEVTAAYRAAGDEVDRLYARWEELETHAR